MKIALWPTENDKLQKARYVFVEISVKYSTTLYVIANCIPPYISLYVAIAEPPHLVRHHGPESTVRQVDIL